jgi:hypothetical protein
MKFKIEKDVPAPVGRPSKWPFIHMEVGESVYIAGEDMNGHALRAARQVGFRSGGEKIFVGRLERDGIRIWRTQ